VTARPSPFLIDHSGVYCVARFTGNELSGALLRVLARDMGWKLDDLIIETQAEETYGGTSVSLEIWSRGRCAKCMAKL
jgi:hypothetical protein